ncbi:MAG: hypothetical protein ABR616_10315 [Dermatophilaceae bacterium]
MTDDDAATLARSDRVALARLTVGEQSAPVYRVAFDDVEIGIVFKVSDGWLSARPDGWRDAHPRRSRRAAVRRLLLSQDPRNVKIPATPVAGYPQDPREGPR